MKKRYWLIHCAMAFILICLIVWSIEIIVANRIAERDFADEPCWLVQTDRPIRFPRLVPGPKGSYIPNLLRQLNRRYVGLGVYDLQVRSPHFAVAGLDAKGRPALWGWSYLKMDFWSLTEKSQSRRSGPLTDFISEEKIAAACPGLEKPKQAARLR